MVAAKVVLFLVLLAFPAFALSVDMNLAFRIGGDKDNIIHANDTDFNATTTTTRTFTSLEKKYISAERNGTFLGLIFAGSEFLSAGFNTTFSANDYLLRMSQDDNKNRFVIAASNGTGTNINDDLSQFNDGLAGKVIGALTFAVPNAFDFFIRLEYADVDIAGRSRFDGATRLFIRNAGRLGKIHNVTVDVIR